jgi:hypothetical protein
MTCLPNDNRCHPEPAERGEGPRKQLAAFFVKRGRKPLERSLAPLGMTN